MKLTLHDRRTIVDPTAADIDRLFASLSDAGDFIILSDERWGEVRSAGPQNGTFLLQCNLARDGGVFRGERHEVGLAEATGIFRQFLAGQVQWSSQFRTVDPLPIQVKVAVAIAVVLGAFLLWWFSRG